MNLLCPSCQKMLTVPEQFAGQLMKCPLCNNNFTVPGLAHSPVSPPPETYGFVNDPVPPPPPAPVPPPMSPPPAGSSLPGPPPVSPPPPSPLTSSPAVSQSKAPPPSAEGYTRKHTLTFSPRFLGWIAPACLLLIFFLQLFTWTGICPGGVSWLTGNAWQTAFGFYSHDHDLDELMRPIATARDNQKVEDYSPGGSPLLIVYLLLFFPALAVTILSVALPYIHVQLPAGIQKVVPWRWGIVAAANLLLFLFLGMQLLVGFGIDSRYSEDVTKAEQPAGKRTDEVKQADAIRGRYLDDLTCTIWLKLVVLFHLIAIFGSILMFWVDQRGTHRPLPRVELAW